jgi:hypothetical protein
LNAAPNGFISAADEYATTLAESGAEAFIQPPRQENQNAGSNPGASAKSGAADATKKSQNPISDLVSLPFQSNWNFGNGDPEQTSFIGLLQPVIPMKVNKRWNLVTRPIIPLVNLPVGGVDREHGLGNITWQNFFVPVPAMPSPWTWGIGPSCVLPTASEPALGLQQWGMGVSGVIVYSKGPIVAGTLINQNYIEAGLSQPFLLQPFFNYNFEAPALKGWFLGASGEFQGDWRAPDDQRWLSVLGIGPGRSIKLFGQPMIVSTRFAPYLDGPPEGPDWQFRLVVSMLFPK